MCGIVGCIAKRNVRNILIEGLHRLEYRGYDSAGVAIIQRAQGEEKTQTQLHLHRVCGKVAALEEELRIHRPSGTLGIAHTRWATHGGVTVENAHPHVFDNRFALVHNGIIENFTEIKQKLQKKKYTFNSETDSEVIVVLLHDYFIKYKNLLKAVGAMIKDLEGSYSLAIIDKENPNNLIGVRRGSPLVVGMGVEENFLASDPLALLQVTDKFIYLEDDEIAILTEDKVIIQNFKGVVRRHKVEIYDHGFTATERGEYNHYMLKEIYEQPQAISNTLSGRILRNKFLPEVLGEKGKELIANTNNIYITGCGTSHNSALIARYQFEEYLNINVLTEVASEFRYMARAVPPQCLYLTISQSGETADILAALKDIKNKAQTIAANKSKSSKKNGAKHINNETNFLASVAICNVPSSTLARLCDIPLITAAGPEIGVASTKAFTAQLTALLLLLGYFLSVRGASKDEKELVRALHKLPDDLAAVLETRSQIQEIAESIEDKNNAMFIARGMLYPVAQEGALKLKEVSYIHAEAYPGGELKHGPLALIEKNFPTIALASKGKYLQKMKSNMQEVVARGGPLFVFNDVKDKEISRLAEQVVILPQVHPLLAPIIYALPMQLLAYETAVLLGTDVDQPRNLAKSVTVE